MSVPKEPQFTLLLSFKPINIDKVSQCDSPAIKILSFVINNIFNHQKDTKYHNKKKQQFSEELTNPLLVIMLDRLVMGGPDIVTKASSKHLRKNQVTFANGNIMIEASILRQLSQEFGGARKRSLFELIAKAYELISIGRIDIAEWSKVVVYISILHSLTISHSDVSFENFLVNGSQIKFNDDVIIYCGKTNYKSPEVVAKKICLGFDFFLLIVGEIPWRKAYDVPLPLRRGQQLLEYFHVIKPNLSNLYVFWSLFIDPYTFVKCGDGLYSNRNNIHSHGDGQHINHVAEIELLLNELNHNLYWNIQPINMYNMVYFKKMHKMYLYMRKHDVHLTDCEIIAIYLWSSSEELTRRYHIDFANNKPFKWKIFHNVMMNGITKLRKVMLINIFDKYTPNLFPSLPSTLYRGTKVFDPQCKEWSLDSITSFTTSLIVATSFGAMSEYDKRQEISLLSIIDSDRYLMNGDIVAAPINWLSAHDVEHEWVVLPTVLFDVKINLDRKVLNGKMCNLHLKYS